MNILFLHQNFPGQFKHLAPALVRAGHRVVALTIQPIVINPWNGVQLVSYRPMRGTTPGIHPWVGDFETKVIRGHAVFNAARELKQQGFEPDVVIAHPGWGESLFVKEVWPRTRLGVYCEFFYQPQGADTGFDPEIAPAVDTDSCRLRLKNLNNLLHMDVADAGIAPTQWQASTFPLPFRQRITVVHDGIDTSQLSPNPRAQLQLQRASGETLQLSRHNEVITFVNRNLEPYRGYHTFMRALPELLQRRPLARVVLVGGDGVSYGAPPNAAQHGASSWKEVFVREVRQRISDADWERVHFVGKLPYTHFVTLLQLSSVHVYLTYPFVLSWSLLEAMSLGCTIVASDTAPVREAIQHNQTGRLVDFFNAAALAGEVCALLDNEGLRAQLSANARTWAREHVDLLSLCLPKQLEWVQALRNA